MIIIYTTQFIRYCIDNKPILFLLSLYFSHLFQSDLFAINRHRVLRLISKRSTSAPSIVYETIISYFISSSFSDVHTLRSINETFNEALIKILLITSIRQHGRKLSGIVKYLQVDISILRQENAKLKYDQCTKGAAC